MLRSEPPKLDNISSVSTVEAELWRRNLTLSCFPKNPKRSLPFNDGSRRPSKDRSDPPNRVMRGRFVGVAAFELFAVVAVTTEESVETSLLLRIGTPRIKLRALDAF